MMFTKIGFKLVRQIKEKFYSYVKADHERGEVEYIANKWVKPRQYCGQLAVFKTVGQVHSFLLKYDSSCAFMGKPVPSYAVFKCEYIQGYGREMFCKRPNRREEIMPLEVAPYGTTLAKKVKLLYEV